MPSGLLSNLKAFVLGKQRLFLGNPSSQFPQSNSVHVFIRATSGLVSHSIRQLGSFRDKETLALAVPRLYNRVACAFSDQGFAYHSKKMAASGSASCLIVDSVITNSGNVSAKPSAVYSRVWSIFGCQKATISAKLRESNNFRYACGCSVFDIASRSHKYTPLFVPQLSKYHTSSSSCYSDAAVPDVSCTGPSLNDEVTSSDKKALAGPTLKLISGSCYLPHPDKEETGGEDAHFVCVNEQAIGVADGVGGWADVGVSSAEYSRQLMSYSAKAIQEEPEGCIDTARVLEKAYSKTMAKGSSTACIIALTKQGLHAINLGDSGFTVVRGGRTIFQSPVQQHGFNFTYQLQSGDKGDVPSSGQVFTIPVEAGDVIVAGTDGVFDNLYKNEVNAIVVDASRAGFSPEVTAQKIAALARQRAQDKDRQTPFSTAAQDAGFRFYGGKLDDITVIVSYIITEA